MSRHRIPTAEYRTFIDFDEASAYIQSVDHNVVIKADGLAAGKGVVIPATKAEAITALQAIMVRHHLGIAGTSVVIEEFWMARNLVCQRSLMGKPP